MGIKTFVLKEELCHPGYAWPRSCLSYQLEFAPGEAHKDSLWLRSEAGAPLPMQLNGLHLEGDYVLGGELLLLGDLPPGGERRFHLEYEDRASDGERQDQAGAVPHRDAGESAGTAGAVSVRQLDSGMTDVDNGRLRVVFPPEAAYAPGKGTILFELGTVRDGLLAKAWVQGAEGAVSVERKQINLGPIRHEYAICCRFTGGASYTLVLRITAGMECLELEETMEGFDAANGSFLVLEWDGLQADSRYARYRGKEQTDAFLLEEGLMPFRLLPYDNLRSWHRTNMAVFYDEKQSVAAGIFTGDAAKWDDGEYALWRSSDTLAIRFRKQGRVRWEYPLATGRRSSYAAVYDAAVDVNRDQEKVNSNSHESEETEAYIGELYQWFTLIPLNKVKDWVLDWEEPQEQYPRLFEPALLPETVDWGFFKQKGVPLPEEVEEALYRRSYSLNHVLYTGPVTSREFAGWVPLLDLTAREMDPARFRRLKAAAAFMAYVREDENIMPVRTMLAGHPNFLMDIKAVPGLMSALFPGHPHAGRWMEDFERSMALNLKYHTRPEIPAWEAKGGRWTENLGCYVWAALVPAVRTAWCIRKTYKRNTLLQSSHIYRLAGWLVESLSAPVAGRRSYPPQGAHSGGYSDPFEPPYILRVLGEMLMASEPLLAEQLLAVCPPDASGFEEREKGMDVWRQMLHGPSSSHPGTPPVLTSIKHTGYGITLRADVNGPREMSVHLQQIDEGPNYRWGRSGEGGCGSVYYYAEGKRFSYNRPEDVGDDNMGDGEGVCAFAALHGHEYRTIGRNELTEPLQDYGFAQFAELLAGPYAKPFYMSRSVIMSGNDYIVLFDQVADLRVRGRFSWFSRKGEELPEIVQLKPGVPGVPVALGGPADHPPVPGGTYVRGNYPHGYPDGAPGVYYDGFGHFLTLVTHHKQGGPILVRVEATAYGAFTVLADRTDHIFRDGAELRWEKGDAMFRGNAGIIRCHDNGVTEAALFKGTAIGVGGIRLELAGEGREDAEGNEYAEGPGSGCPGGLAFRWDGERICGQSVIQHSRNIRLTLHSACAATVFRLYVNGREAPFRRIADAVVEFMLSPGCSTWEWTDRMPVPGVVEITGADVSAHKIHLQWQPVPAAESYQAAISRDSGLTWTEAANVRGDASGCILQDMTPGDRFHVRVRARNDASAGPWSAPYPLQATDALPEAPEGLRLARIARGLRLSWGRPQGAGSFRLWKQERQGGDFYLIYEGGNQEYTDGAAQNVSSENDAAYCVSVVNGNGESPRSQMIWAGRGGPADWDPRPEEGFRRYSRSHEYGYNGFDYWRNEQKGTLQAYPDSTLKQSHSY